MIAVSREFLVRLGHQAMQRTRDYFADVDSLRQRLDYQTILLATCAFVATLTLGLGDVFTQPAIERRQAEDLKATLSEVLPAGFYDNDLLAKPVELKSQIDETGAERTSVYVARKDGAVTAVAFKMLALGGYAGPLTLMVGIDREGRLLGVRVIAHAETPGLGDKVEVVKSDWITRFTGRSLEDPHSSKWRVKKDGGDFDQFTGATITPRAVVKGVEGGLRFFARHRDALINATD